MPATARSKDYLVMGWHCKYGAMQSSIIEYFNILMLLASNLT
jgi:hypothetical protein